MIDLHADVATMLAAHTITAPEIPFTHDGYSGATMTRITQGDHRYIVKRVSRSIDWIIQMTSDHALREAQIGASDVLDRLKPGVRSPSIAAARDGDGFALLMHDLTPCLLPRDGRLPQETLDLILRRVAEMHACFWGASPPQDIGWCGRRERLLMLSEPAAERLRDAGFMLSGGFAAGWQQFHRAAPRGVSDLVRSLHTDPGPLIAVCESLPQTLLHGDVKIANIASDGDTVWLFDWALAGFGPVCTDLGWFLGVYSSRLPWTLDDTMSRYGEHLRGALAGRFIDGEWKRQQAAAYVCGLILFGWAKGDDASELAWWCERATEAAGLLEWHADR